MNREEYDEKMSMLLQQEDYKHFKKDPTLTVEGKIRKALMKKADLIQQQRR